MSIFFGLLFARRFYCRSALSLSPGRTGGLFPRINAPVKALREFDFRSAFYLSYNTNGRSLLQKAVEFFILF